MVDSDLRIGFLRIVETKMSLKFFMESYFNSFGYMSYYFFGSDKL